MSMKDFTTLEREHSAAVAKATSAATVIAELVADGKQPGQEEIGRYVEARLGVESTRRDLETCINRELDITVSEKWV